MPPLSRLLQPKYLAVMVLSLVGFLLMYVATGGDIDLVVWDYEWESLKTSTQILAFVIGLILLAGAAIYMYRDYASGQTDDVSFTEAPFPHFLFNSSASAPLWLGIRLYLGFEWLSSGWGKLDNPAWRNGDALQGYWERAVFVPSPEQAAEGARAPVVYDSWRRFLEYMLENEWYNWFNWLLMIGETLVGLGLILGALTGVAAFFGAVMNVSFLLSGTVSSNPVFLILAILLILAWRVAGYIGLDRILLPALGTPWQNNIGGSFKAIREGRIPPVPPAERA
jgi:thiosulfate dehydrogenase (quinone) large subunit